MSNTKRERLNDGADDGVKVDAALLWDMARGYFSLGFHPMAHVVMKRWLLRRLPAYITIAVVMVVLVVVGRHRHGL